MGSPSTKCGTVSVIKIRKVMINSSFVIHGTPHATALLSLLYIGVFVLFGIIWSNTAPDLSNWITKDDH